jgi:hypothetical protein
MYSVLPLQHVELLTYLVADALVFYWGFDKTKYLNNKINYLF